MEQIKKITKILEPSYNEISNYFKQGQETFLKIACQDPKNRKLIKKILKENDEKNIDATNFLKNEIKLKKDNSYYSRIKYYFSILKNKYYPSNKNYNIIKCKEYLEEEDKYLRGDYNEQFTKLTCSIESIRGMLKRLEVKKIPSTIAFLLKYGKQNPVNILAEDKVFSLLVQVAQLFTEHYRAVRLFLENQFLTGYTAEGFKKIINESFSDEGIKAYHVITNSHDETKELIQNLAQKENTEIMFNILDGDFGWHSIDFKKYNKENNMIYYYEGGVDFKKGKKLDALINEMKVNVPKYFSFKCKKGIPLSDLTNKGISTKELFNGYNPIKIPDNGQYSMLVLTKNKAVKSILDKKENVKEKGIKEKISPFLRTGYDQYISYAFLSSSYWIFPQIFPYLLGLQVIKSSFNFYKIFNNS